MLVVFDHPPVGRFTNIIDAGEQMLAQHLVAEGAVEAFDVRVLVGLAGLDVLDRHGIGLGPLHEGFAQELRAVVRAQHLR